MDVEIYNFIKVWVAAISALCYCYFVVKRIPSGLTRFLSLLPIIYLFITLPFSLSSAHLGGPTILYLVWLGNFKLILFSFNQGPLSSSQRPLSLLHFISIALLPIKTASNSFNHKSNASPLDKSPPDAKNGIKQDYPSPDSDISEHEYFKKFRAALMVVKVVLLGVIVSAYNYRQYLHPAVIMALYCCNVYLGVELVLAITAFPVRAILGLELEPQFNEPYLSTSLQDFWGHRWNLMVTGILRSTVFNPLRSISTPVLGRKWSLLPAIFATFLVSGLMHEIIYYYLTRADPTWEVTWFFIFHGICVASEVAIKKALNGRWRLHRALSGPLTIVFVGVTGAWLFFPQLIRNGTIEKIINEYSITVRFFKESVRSAQSYV